MPESTHDNYVRRFPEWKMQESFFWRKEEGGSLDVLDEMDRQILDERLTQRLRTGDRSCILIGCPNDYESHGLCKTHDARWRDAGSPYIDLVANDEVAQPGRKRRPEYSDAKDLYENTNLSVRDIARWLSIPYGTVFPWTMEWGPRPEKPEDPRIEELAKKGLSTKAIVEKLGCTEYAARMVRVRLGLIKPRSRENTGARVAEHERLIADRAIVARMHGEGASQVTIASALNTSRRTVQRHLKALASEENN